MEIKFSSPVVKKNALARRELLPLIGSYDSTYGDDEYIEQVVITHTRATWVWYYVLPCEFFALRK
ncbi:hypothetical protein [Endozoicomonas lisbonensis]|uniref:Uncharacterized protein n=1 Tax=Endozoicomonas lisbonensis TaxID=3120522 RepID=A0ABV2SEX4_9GAMM